MAMAALRGSLKALIRREAARIPLGWKMEIGRAERRQGWVGV